MWGSEGGVAIKITAGCDAHKVWTAAAGTCTAAVCLLLGELLASPVPVMPQNITQQRSNVSTPT